MFLAYPSFGVVPFGRAEKRWKNLSVLRTDKAVRGRTVKRETWKTGEGHGGYCVYTVQLLSFRETFGLNRLVKILRVLKSKQ